MDDFFVLGSFVGNMVAQERPVRILEISGGGNQYGYLLKAAQAHCGISDGTVDRIAIAQAQDVSAGAAYDRVFGETYLDNPDLLDRYDLILMSDLPEWMAPETVRALLDALQYKVSRQILLLTALTSEEGYRKYHPVVFLGLAFSYSLIPGVSKAMQAYSVFPKAQYAALSMDLIPMPETAEKLRIAFALPHQVLTGGLKALLQKIRHLKRSGHTVSVYVRSDSAKSAIPPWSDLTEEDYTRQVVVPGSDNFSGYMQDADIIVLGDIIQAPEFLLSKTPVVLWEQGSEAIFGDFGKALHSASAERLSRHRLYRLPIHLLAVSEVITTALKGVYNREAVICPCGVDTAFYHPAEKHNDTPVVLLTGHPALAFKGFHFAFDVLNRAYADGLRFQVKWAAQVRVIHGKTNFPLEVIVRPPQQELAALYRSADIFLSPSLYESYPLPPLEAMASGTAVIATDCGGIRAYARDGENCILCRQGDLSAATDALVKLIRHPDERQRLALAGRETALERSAETVIAMLERSLFRIVQYRRSGVSGT